MVKLFANFRRSALFQKTKNEFNLFFKAVKYIASHLSGHRDNGSIFIFNHIPKCGGTSLLNILGKWFYVYKDYPPHDLKFSNEEEQKNALQKYIEDKPEYLNLNPWEIISGHYHLPEFEISKRFPRIFENSRIRVITFVREPLDLMLSHYYYGKRKGHSYIKGDSIEEYLLNAMPNQLSHALGCNESNYKERLDHYFFIGSLETFESSIQALARLLKKPIQDNLPHSNPTSRDVLIDEIEETVIQKFKTRNKLDYLVYDYAKLRVESFLS